jgi:AcrR family transcriptional regulator
VESEAGLRERKKRDKEARIRAAALALMREKGFAATTTAEVARKAGIATGTLFLYVKSKEELLDLVFSGEIGEVAERGLATLPHHADIVTKLLHVFRALYDYYARDLEISRVLLTSAVLPSERSRSAPLTMQFLARVGALIEEAQRRGELAGDAFPVELALFAFTLYVGGVMTIINRFGDVDAACQTLRRGLELLFRGLRPPPKKPKKRRRKP